MAHVDPSTKSTKGHTMNSTINATQFRYIFHDEAIKRQSSSLRRSGNMRAVIFDQALQPPGNSWSNMNETQDEHKKILDELSIGALFP